MNDLRPNTDHSKDSGSEAPWNVIREALRGLEFGSVTLTVQDGVLIQVERLEKKRLRRPAASA